MPRFSIITPVFDPPIKAFDACARSVFRQSYSDWEWILVDDGSTDREVLDYLRRLDDPRVRVRTRHQNGGIVEASNDALNLASGEFIVLLDHDDLLANNALKRVDEVLSENPRIDYLYSDEDKVDDEGRFFDPFRKPAWSPERLRSQNYCCHLSVIRAELMRELGGFRTGYDGSQDFDLILRITERAQEIAHVPEILYHWRVVPGSTAGDAGAKPYAIEAARRAVSEHLDRLGIDADVTVTPDLYLKSTRRLSRCPLVSIIIPTCGSRKRVWGREAVLVETAVASIIQRSTYENYEIVIVYDDPLTPDDVIDRLRHIAGDRLRLVPYRKSFNFSEKCNLGVVSSSGEYVVLLNDDTSIQSPGWIEGLICYFVEPDVGMVGPKLLLEDGRIQSAGHFNKEGPNNVAFGHHADDRGPFSVLQIAAERSGLTMACTAIPRRIYNHVGGLSPEYPRAFNDVDFGNKLWLLGYRMIWNPHVVIHHFESATRNPSVSPKEIHRMWERWGYMVNGRDPFLPWFSSAIHGIDHDSIS